MLPDATDLTKGAVKDTQPATYIASMIIHFRSVFLMKTVCNVSLQITHSPLQICKLPDATDLTKGAVTWPDRQSADSKPISQLG